jgi:hypothetical protein
MSKYPRVRALSRPTSIYIRTPSNIAVRNLKQPQSRWPDALVQLTGRADHIQKTWFVMYFWGDTCCGLWPMGVFVRALVHFHSKYIFVIHKSHMWSRKNVIDSNTRGLSCGANSLVALSRFIFESRTFPMVDAYADVASKTTLHHGRTWLMMRKRRINTYMRVPLGK